MTHALRYLPDSAPPDDIVERNRHFARKWDRAWEAAKTAYLAGEPAKAVCRRHGLALSTFRYHAKIEGWRRCDADLLEEAPPPDAPPSPPQPSPSGSTRGSDDPPAHAEPPEPQPHPADAEAQPALAQEYDPDPAYAVLLGDARRHLAKAVRNGRPLDAQRWLRVMRELAPLAEQEAKDEVEEAFDAGVLVDLAGPMPFGKLSDDQILYAARALRRTIDSRQAKERAGKSAPNLDSPAQKTLDSSPSSPVCRAGGPRNGGGGEPHTPTPPDRPPPLPDERDEINGFYRSRPYAASHPIPCPRPKVTAESFVRRTPGPYARRSADPGRHSFDDRGS